MLPDPCPVAFIQRSALAHHRYSQTGGAIDIVGGMVTIDQCVLSNNFAQADAGIAIGGTGSVLVENSTISGNTASFGDDGIVIFNNASPITVIGCAITNNNTLTRDGQGGGRIYDGSSSPLTVPDSIIASAGILDRRVRSLI